VRRVRGAADDGREAVGHGAAADEHVARLAMGCGAVGHGAATKRACGGRMGADNERSHCFRPSG
jgi:hypothetical protein